MNPTTKPVIYIAGPYLANTEKMIRHNMGVAIWYAAQFWVMGFGVVIIPHLNSYSMEIIENLPLDRILEGNLKMIEWADCVYMLPFWQNSLEADREREYAVQLGKVIFYNLHEAQNWLKRKEDEDEEN